jgi:hypothetical protein
MFIINFLKVWGPLRQSGAPQHHDLFFFLDQLDIWYVKIPVWAAGNSPLEFLFNDLFFFFVLFWEPVRPCLLERVFTIKTWEHCCYNKVHILTYFCLILLSSNKKQNEKKLETANKSRINHELIANEMQKPRNPRKNV